MYFIAHILSPGEAYIKAEYDPTGISRVKRALQGFSIRLWCRIQGILLQIKIKSKKKVSQILQVDVFVKDLIFKLPKNPQTSLHLKTAP